MLLECRCGSCLRRSGAGAGAAWLAVAWLRLCITTSRKRLPSPAQSPPRRPPFLYATLPQADFRCQRFDPNAAAAPAPAGTRHGPRPQAGVASSVAFSSLLPVVISEQRSAGSPCCSAAHLASACASLRRSVAVRRAFDRHFIITLSSSAEPAGSVAPANRLGVHNLVGPCHGLAGKGCSRCHPVENHAQ